MTVGLRFIFYAQREGERDPRQVRAAFVFEFIIGDGEMLGARACVRGFSSVRIVWENFEKDRI